MNIKRQANIGDIIYSINSPGYAVVISIDIGNTQYNQQYYIIKYKRLCNKYFKPFKNSKIVSCQTTYIPFRVEKDHFKELKDTISLIESYIK